MVGLEISDRWLKEAKKRFPDTELILGDALNTTFGNDFFDVVVAIGLFEYVNRNFVIKEIKRILKNDCYCIIVVPNKYSAFRMVVKLISRIYGRKKVVDEPSEKEMTKLFFIGRKKIR